MNKDIKPVILAIDTSCDDTSVAILQSRRVLSSVVSSQVEIHAQWGGVVPDIARREHERNIHIVFEQALQKAKVTMEEFILAEAALAVATADAADCAADP